ncbi:tandem-95 repeat protein [Candidatus Poribacteria bacterium]|nr:tandem-95 repeat protein [Candidatus Poribacteria bacterium]
MKFQKLKRILPLWAFILWALSGSIFPALAAIDSQQTTISASGASQFMAPFAIPQGFPFNFNFLITTQAEIKVVNASGKVVFSMDETFNGITIDKSYQLQIPSPGDYTVNETFHSRATPDSPFLGGSFVEGEVSFSWSFTASSAGTYELHISAKASNLDADVEGDFSLSSIGDLAPTVPVSLVSARNIKAGEKIKYTASYSVDFEKTTTISRPSLPPEIQALQIGPVIEGHVAVGADAFVTSTIGVILEATDDTTPPENLIKKYTWFKNGSPISGQTGNTLSGIFKKGDEIYLKVSVTDESGKSTEGESNHIRILNSPPTQPASFSITPAQPKTTDDLIGPEDSALGSRDSDGDPIHYVRRWFKGDTSPGNEQTAYRDQRSVPAFATSKGETWILVITASDGEAESGPSQASVTIVNSPPQIAAIPDQTGKEGEEFSYTVSATDPDGDPLTFSIETDYTGDQPQIDPSTGQITWTLPSVEAEGLTVQITVTVTDGEAQTQKVFALQIQNANHKPSLAEIEDTPIPVTVGDDGVVTEDASVEVTVSATDQDGDEISFRAIPQNTDHFSVQAVGDVTVSNGTYSQTFQVSVLAGFQLDMTDPTKNIRKVRFIAQDTSGAPNSTDSILVQFIVSQEATPNRPPSIADTVPSTVTSDEGQPITLEITASDPDGDPLTWEGYYLMQDINTGVLRGISPASIDPSTGQFTWTPDMDQAGTYVLAFAVVDPGGLKAQKLITFQIRDVNQVPQVSSDALDAYDEGQLIRIVVTAMDMDGDVVSFRAEGMPSGSSFSPATLTYDGDKTYSQTFVWRTSYTDAGNYTIKFYATDQRGGEAKLEVSFQVRDVNRPPAFQEIAAQSVKEGDTLSFEILARDPDNDPLTYEKPSGPGNFDPTSRMFTWTPNFDESGDYTVEFKVSDGKGGEDSMNVEISVEDVNRPPQLSLPDVLTYQEGARESLNLLGYGSDPDGDPLSFTFSSDLPDGSYTFSDPVVDLAFSYEHAGEYTATVIANDGKGGVTSGSFRIVVENVNRAPVFTATSYEVSEGESLVHNILDEGVFSDPDGDRLSVSLVDGPEGLELDPNGYLAWRPNYDQAGEYDVSIEASDGTDTTSGSIHVAVHNVNRPPTVTLSNQTFEQGEYEGGVTIPIEASDPDNDPLTVNAVLQIDPTNAPDGYSADYSVNENNEFVWNNPISGVHSLSVEVTDGTDTASVTVRLVMKAPQVNLPPTFKPVGAQSVNEGETLEIQLEAVDPEGDPIRYDFAGIQPQPVPAGVVDLNAETGLFTWQTEFDDRIGDREYVASFTVYQVDRPNLSDLLQVPITIKDVNRPPVLSGVAIEPPSPRGSDALRVIYRLSDPDNNPSPSLTQATIRWFKNGKAVPELDGHDTVPAEMTRSGDEWKVQVTPMDDLNMAGEMTEASVGILNTPPLLSLSVDPAIGTTRDTFNFEAIYSDADGDAPSKVELIIDDGSPITMVQDANDPNRFTYSTRLPKGDHTFKGRASDGTDTYETSPATLTVQNSPPQVRISASGLNSYTFDDGHIFRWGSGTLSFTFQVDDFDGDLVDLKVEIVIGWSAGTPTDTTRTFNDLAPGSSVVYNWDSTSLPWAQCLIRVTASDGETTATFTYPEFVVQNYRSLAPSLDPVPPSSGDAQITGTVPGLLPLPGFITMQVAIYVDGTLNGYTGVSDGRFGYTLSGLGEGIYSVTAEPFFVFAWGPWFFRWPAGPTSSPVRVIIDQTPPIANILDPADGSTVVTLSPSLVGYADDPSGIKSAELKLYRVRADGSRAQVRIFPEPYDPESRTIRFDPPSGFRLVQGSSYVVVLDVTDQAGNASSAEAEFLVNVFKEDTTPPVAGDLKPADGNMVATDMPVISALLTDAQSGIDESSLKASLDGTPAAVTYNPVDVSRGRAIVTLANGLTDGSHTVEISFADKNGNQSSVSWGFSVDTTPPNPPTFNPIPSPTDLQSITITGHGEGRVELFVNNRLFGATEADTNSGTFTFTGVPISEGMNLLAARAKDALGNVSEMSDQIQVIGDMTPPDIKLISPEPGSLTPLLSPEVLVLVSDALSKIDPNSVSMSINGTQVSADYDEATGSLRYTPDVPFEDNSTVIVEVRASDVAGNAGSMRESFAVYSGASDNTPPSITDIRIDGVPFTVGMLINDSSPQIRATVADPESGISGMTVSVNGQPLSDYTYDADSHILSFSPALSDGVNRIAISVVNGNDLRSDAAFEVSVDTFISAPTVTVRQSDGRPLYDPPDYDVRYTGDPSVIISVKVEPDDGIGVGGSVTAYIGSTPVGMALVSAVPATFDFSGQLSQGSNLIRVEATDAAGNNISSDMTTIHLDTTSPQITFLQPVDGSVVGPDVTLRVRYEDESGVNFDHPASRIVIKRGYRVIEDITASEEHDLTGLEDGEYLVIASAADTAGNVGTFSMSFRVDSQPPHLAVIDPASDDEVIPNKIPVITAEFDQNDADLNTLQVTMTKETGETVDILPPAVNPVNGSITVVPSVELEDGGYMVELSLADKVGNVARATRSFFVDTAAQDKTPPILSGFYPADGSVINSTSLALITFIAGDSGSGIDEGSLILYVNGEPFQVSILMQAGMASYNRGTGQVTVFLNRSLAQAPGGAPTIMLDPLMMGQLEKSLGAGVNTIGVDVADKSGNVRTVQWSFTVTLEPPKAPVLDALPEVVGKNMIDVSGKVADVRPNNPVKVSLMVNGVLAGTADVDAETGKFKIEGVLLPENINTLYALAVDSAGNQSPPSGSVQIKLDLQPPIISVDLPQRTNEKVLGIAGTIVEEVGLKGLNLTVNGQSQSVDVAKDGSFSLSVELKEGENDLEFEATDVAGNTTAKSFKVNLDTTPPTAAAGNLKLAVTTEGKVELSWDASPDASGYNVYRGAEPIENVSKMTPLKQVSATTWVDTTAARGKTYFYTVTPLDDLGNEAKDLLSNVPNIALIGIDGGLAQLPDGTRARFLKRSVSDDPFAIIGVTLTAPSESDLPALPNAIAGTARSMTAIDQNGKPVDSVKSVTITIPYPQNIQDSAESPKVYHLEGDKWVELPGLVDTQANKVSVVTDKLGTFMLAQAVLRPWDVDGNGAVNIFDLVIVGKNFGKKGEGLKGDINNDGTVNIFDLVLVGKHFGEKYTETAGAPAIAAGSIELKPILREIERGIFELEIRAIESIYGFQMKVSTGAGRIISVEHGDILGDNAYWMPSKIENGTLDLTATALGELSPKGDLVAKVRFSSDAPPEISLSHITAADEDGRPLDVKLLPVRFEKEIKFVDALYQNYPNPFNPETWIPFELSKESDVKIEIYDISGRLIRELNLGRLKAGRYISRDKAAYWDGRNRNGELISSGIYYYVIQAGQFRQMRKMVILK